MNVKTSAFETKFTYTDQESDDESGLMYYGARYYHPTLGRFTQADPVIVDTGRREFTIALANPQLLNPYSYTANNPLNQVDVEGEFTWKTFGVGVWQLGTGSLQTIFGGLEIASGAAIATGGTATGVGAVPGIAGGVALGALGANNVVGGSTSVYSGGANLIGAFQDKSPVDKSFDPAHKAIDALVPEGTGNLATHVGFAIVDTVAGGVGIAKELKNVTGTKTIIDNANVLIKVENQIAIGIPKIDATIAVKAGFPRLHIGYDLLHGWHAGLGTTSKTLVHTPGMDVVLAGVSAVRGAYQWVKSKLDQK